MTQKEKQWEKKVYGCWLSCVPGIGNRTIEKLLALCPTEKEVYLAGSRLWKQVLSVRQFEQIQRFAVQNEPEVLYGRLLDKQIQFWVRDEEGYPERLKRIPDAPYGLFVKGKLPDEERPAVAVIGARDCSEYGRYVAENIGRLMGENGIQVISGMARGIDGIGQKAALMAGGSSFGVLGCGVDICYPASNKTLYEDLCRQGGVLSAYPPTTEARPGNFPPRNRIVSGLADALIVVEARQKSGTLITVDMALEQGKDVYVVPGRITDRLSDGCNRLIRQGAEILLSPGEFIQELLQRQDYQDAKNGYKLKGQQEEIYAALNLDPITPEQLQVKLSVQYSLPKLMSLLMGMCAQGIIRQVGQGYFVRKGEGVPDR